MANFSRKALAATRPMKKQFLAARIAAVGALLGIFAEVACAQSTSPSQAQMNTVQGTVRSSAGESLAGVVVRLEEKEQSISFETKSNMNGSFVFSEVRPGVYTVRAEKSGWRECVSNPLVLNAEIGRASCRERERCMVARPGFSREEGQ